MGSQESIQLPQVTADLVEQTTERSVTSVVSCSIDQDAANPSPLPSSTGASNDLATPNNLRNQHTTHPTDSLENNSGPQAV